MYCTFTKIGDRWGVKVVGDANPGDVVEVLLKDGRVRTETLGELIAQVEDREGRRLPVFATVQKAREVAQVGDLSNVMTLFNRAKAHLKYPAIVLSVPAINETIKVSVAGPRAKVPGSLTVVSKDRTDAEGRKVWYGRVHQDGRFEQSRQADAAVAARLRELANDPVKVASEHGRLTGACTFCNLPLKDERSTAVGYGKTCADHFGLPWGKKHDVFEAAEAA